MQLIRLLSGTGQCIKKFIEIKLFIVDQKEKIIKNIKIYLKKYVEYL